MKRRQFLNWVGVGFVASSLPVAIAACQSDEPTSETPEPDEPVAETPAPIDSTPREDGFAAVGYVSELDEVGFITGQTVAGDPVAIVRDPTDPTVLIAVNSSCPHRGCTVEWDSEASQFACPCHGSTFDPDGTVTKSPAIDPLFVFEAKIEDDLILVKAS